MASKFDAEALELHERHHGKLAITPTVPIATRDDLSRAYTPGVAAPCLAIKDNPDKIYDYTTKGNMVAVVTNGTAVLGLGNIGAGAGLPVMEGKSILFKGFAGVDSVPVCVNSQKVEDVVKVCQLIAPTYGGINLEDIKAPQCFDIENELKKTLDIPVFHDDQHGTAIVVVSALLNAYKYLEKDLRTAKIVINGAGAAGQAIARLLFSYGIQTVVLCDTTGAVYEGRTENMNPYKDSLAKVSNRQKEKGTLAQIIKGKDIFIGVSAPGSLTPEMIKSMNPDPVIMAMANPVPEILPDEAKAAGARIVCTGRSDFPNQVNNLLAFPGIFRGALDVRAKEINDKMKIAAADAIASLISESELNETNIIASPLDPRVAPTVAAAVAKAALDTGVARRTDITPEDVANHTRELLGHAVG
ncbi:MULTISPECIES: NADP-dependent malic enzyme [Selenomonas]|uniref:NAD-dependent malic enzyme n=1 Tax=Selenomonas timonae TaxID=2754044 RepID=A0A7G7VL72_9FIRM|nr:MULTISPECIES: malic enzyme-like NAD(P)-binding protein [Selenomonas]EKX97537.1 putative NAD-dependent malic enzyme [Selenomonas sp. oral taxon 138 str. F0429]QNH54865.1 NAD-dependent malic enzyme [Selenomonas timonae]